MKLIIKIIITLIIICSLIAAAIILYIQDSSKFDNKKQYAAAEKYYEAGNYQEAYVSFLRIKYFSKYRTIALFKQALSAEKLGDWSIAQIKYEEFIKNVPVSTFTERALYSLGKAYLKNKNYDKALETFSKIREQSKIDDYKIAANYFLGKIYFTKKMYESGKNYFFAYLEAVPNGTYSLSIAYDLINAKQTTYNVKEKIIIAKIFLANKKYDEATDILKNTPQEKVWTYLAISHYYKNEKNIFDKMAKEGFEKTSSGINKNDLLDFTNFYLSIQPNVKEAVKHLQQTGVNNIIPDYLMYKSANYISEEERIKIYKDILDKHPKSHYVKDCLIKIFFDYAKKGDYESAIKTGKLYSSKFAQTPEESQILFWTGKYLLRVNRFEEAEKHFTKLKTAYPDSYYTYRASQVGRNGSMSWSFDKTSLPKENKIRFPYELISNEDKALTDLYFEVGDYTVLDEIPINNLAVRAWTEYKKGNTPKSVYLANKYITESKDKINYSNPVWKLAFPIKFQEQINQNCKLRDLDAFLVLSLIREESYFNSRARSSSNAMGLMQLLMSTAEYIAGLNHMEFPDENKLFIPDYNITLGTAYLSHVLELTDPNIPMYAIGGYNGGPNAMNKWKKTFPTTDLDEFVENIPYAESKNYIKKVYRSRYNYFKIYKTK